MLIPTTKQRRADKIVGQTLKAVRKASGLTQKQVAARLHTSQTLVSDTERGKRSIRTAEVIVYAYGIQTTPQKLFELIERSLADEGLLPALKR